MLAPWKKNYDKPRQHVKNHRQYFATKVCLVKAMIFPVVKSRVDVRVGPKKKAEHQRTDAFEL